jgi:hypothetical protein
MEELLEKIKQGRKGPDIEREKMDLLDLSCAEDDDIQGLARRAVEELRVRIQRLNCSGCCQKSQGCYECEVMMNLQYLRSVADEVAKPGLMGY